MIGVSWKPVGVYRLNKIELDKVTRVLLATAKDTGVEHVDIEETVYLIGRTLDPESLKLVLNKLPNEIANPVRVRLDIESHETTLACLNLINMIFYIDSPDELRSKALQEWATVPNDKVSRNKYLSEKILSWSLPPLMGLDTYDFDYLGHFDTFQNGMLTSAEILSRYRDIMETITPGSDYGHVANCVINEVLDQRKEMFNPSQRDKIVLGFKDLIQNAIYPTKPMYLP